MLTYVDTLIGFAGVMLLLSLLVTLLVQVTLSVFNLRGVSLLWGVTLLVERAHPVLRGTLRAWELAWYVLTHPALSPHGRLATAIRSDELLRALREASVPSVEKRLGLGGAVLKWMRERKTGVVEAAVKSATRAADDPPESGMPADLGAVKMWFDTVMDRTTEQFTARTRAVTLAIAAFLAFALHIDSLALLRQISSNPEQRARLVQSAESTLKMADEVMAQEAKGATLASEALLDASREHKDVHLDALVPANLSRRSQGWAWIDANVKEDAGRGELRKAFDERYDAAVQQRIPELYDTAKKIKEGVTTSELTIVPTDASLKSWIDGAYLAKHPDHLLGVIMTALFLGLGAPFWYNLLRQLGNLRPLLAGKVDRDEKSEKSGGGEGG